MALAETKSVIPPLQLRMDSWFEEADLRISANEKPDDEFMASGYQLLFEKLDPYKEADWIQLTEPSLYHIAGLNIRYEPLSDRIPEFSDMFGEMNDHWAIQVFDYKNLRYNLYDVQTSFQFRSDNPGALAEKRMNIFLKYPDTKESSPRLHGLMRYEDRRVTYLRERQYGGPETSRERNLHDYSPLSVCKLAVALAEGFASKIPASKPS